MRFCLRAWLLALSLMLCGIDPSSAAQPQSSRDAKAVTSVTYDEVKRALADAGATRIRDHTADPNYPSFGGEHSQGASLQATLYACDTVKERCRGVRLLSIIPATSLRNAEVIVGSIESSAFGIDAEVVDLVNRPGSVAIFIKTYLVYDYGVSDKLLSIALDQFVSVIEQTKGFMLKDDPGHADLWSRKD
jgi:hypothetical protein